MQPAHLKSSYPAETQLRPPSEFTDDDLRNGRIERELEEATANLSVDSPANNTRRKSFVKMNISTKKNPTQTSKSPAEIKTSSTTSIPKPTALGKKYALKRYDQFALNTSCFYGSTSQILQLHPNIKFNEFFVKFFFLKRHKLLMRSEFKTSYYYFKIVVYDPH